MLLVEDWIKEICLEKHDDDAGKRSTGQSKRCSVGADRCGISCVSRVELKHFSWFSFLPYLLRRFIEKALGSGTLYEGIPFGLLRGNHEPLRGPDNSVRRAGGQTFTPYGECDPSGGPQVGTSQQTGEIHAQQWTANILVSGRDHKSAQQHWRRRRTLEVEVKFPSFESSENAEGNFHRSDRCAPS